MRGATLGVAAERRHGDVVMCDVEMTIKTSIECGEKVIIDGASAYGP